MLIGIISLALTLGVSWMGYGAARRFVRDRLRYVDGDYADPATFSRVRDLLRDARRPAHYLAIPPSMFATVVRGLQAAGCTSGAGTWPRRAGTSTGRSTWTCA